MQHMCIALITTPKELTEIELDHNFMPLLSSNNWGIVDACIKKLPNYDSAYKVYQNVSKRQRTISQLNRNDVYDIVKAIAKENSTRTPTNPINAFVDYIIDPKYDFWKDLQRGDIKLPDKIYNFVQNKANRKEKSLASKICKYLNDWAYNRKDYTINDSFVRGVLPYYLAYYGVDNKIWTRRKGNRNLLHSFDDEKEPYKAFWTGFYELMQELNRRCISLSTHQIDNLLWYCFRSDGVRFEAAKGFALAYTN